MVHDPSSKLPLFLERFHKLCARALNARWKRWENFWAAEATCAVRLIEDADVLDKVVSALANPVADHLVDRVFDWPGASSLRYTTAVPRTVTIARPKRRPPLARTLPVAHGHELTRTARSDPIWLDRHFYF